MAEFIKRIFTPGTVECAVACALLGGLVALLLLWIGVWKTLLIVILVALGAFLGGTTNKMEKIKQLVGRFTKE